MIPQSLIKFVLFILILICNPVITNGQTNDSLNTGEKTDYESDLDSLNTIVDSLNYRLTKIEKQLSEKTPLDSLLTGFEDVKDTSSIPEDQRSRRKQLDALLELISQRPGQLFFNGQVNAILQGNLPKDNQFSTGTGSLNLFASASFEDGIIIFIDLESIGGNGPDEFAETLISLNGDAGSTQSEDGFDRIVVNEAWTEFLFLNDIFTITAGKIDLTNYFDNNAIANDENSQFISSPLINSSAFAVPSNSPGLRIRTTILERFYIQFGLSKAENTGNNIFKNLYKIGGIGFKLFPNSDYTAEFHLFGYSHPSADNRFGFGVSMSQTIAARFTIFGRFANNENDLADWYGIKNSWSSGAQFIENLIGEPSIIGMAYGSTKPFNQNFKNEKLTEFYVRQMINTWIGISLHYQYVWDSAGQQNRYSLLGLRVNFTF